MFARRRAAIAIVFLLSFSSVPSAQPRRAMTVDDVKDADTTAPKKTTDQL
jgi:hypothetical protein